jgi:hypothetical protein
LNRTTFGLATMLSYRLTGSIAATLAAGLLIAGCAGEKPFARVNGQPITQAEYIKLLERQQILVPGTQQTMSSERFVLDTLIGQKIILAEASKASALPSDKEVEDVYDLRKKLFEQQFPGKQFDATLKEQGSTPEEIKGDIKNQLALTNLYSKKLKVGEDEVRKKWEEMKGQFGLEARVQLRLILTAPGSPEFEAAKKEIAAKKDFNDIAKRINPPQLKATAGLLPQTTPIRSINQKYINEVQQKPEGYTFGPVDFPLAQGQPPFKAWVKIEKKLPPYVVGYEEAAPAVREAVVNQKLQMPENQQYRNEIMQAKLKASFEPGDPAYTEVWNTIKKTAEDAGLGKDAPVAPGAGAGAVGGAPAPGAPGAAAPK